MQLVPSPFDSQHYDLRVARLVRDTADDVVERGIASARGSYDVVFVRVSDGDPWCHALEAAGHRSIDTLVTSTLRPDPPAIARPEIAVEHHATVIAPADIEAVVAITGESIRTSHLHADPRLPAERTRALYASWVRNDLGGRAELTLLARSAGNVIGYLTVVGTATTAMIDLVAVSASWHGRGVGSALIASFIDWARALGRTATVGTQLENPALRLYARCGFVPSAKHFTYHLWLDS